MSRTLLRSLAMTFCMVALHGCFDSGGKNNNADADKSKASVQMQNKDSDQK